MVETSGGQGDQPLAGSGAGPGGVWGWPHGFAFSFLRSKEAVIIQRIIKNKNGFSLVEIIISIAALTFISGFILQMFITSSNLNTRAKNLDVALSKVIGELEEVKAQKTMVDYLELDTALVVDSGISPKVDVFFDEDWNKLKTADVTEENKQYQLHVVFTPEDAAPVAFADDLTEWFGLYTVKAELTDMSGGGHRALTSLETKKYFADIINEGV